MDNTLDILDEKFWNNALKHLSYHSYLNPTCFQGATTDHLRDQLSHLIWKLRQLSETAELVEPRPAERTFSWEENWLLYCLALELNVSPMKLSNPFSGGIEYYNFATWLAASKVYPEGEPLAKDVMYDIWAIGGVFGALSLVSIKHSSTQF